MNGARKSRAAHPAEPHRDAVGVQVLRQFEICQRLGISDDTWRAWRKARKVPAPVPNVPGRPRWRVKDIEDFARGLYGAGHRVYFGAARRSA